MDEPDRQIDSDFYDDALAVPRQEAALVETLQQTRGHSVAERLAILLRGDALSLPMPGGGATWDRFRRLAEIAAEDLSLARLAEGHADALCILGEAGLTPFSQTIYGVWAAGRAQTSNCSPVRLDGVKEYCSGFGLVERALVTAVQSGSGERLFEVSTSATGLDAIEGSWPAVGMKDSASLSVRLNGVNPERSVGQPGFYQERAGFWMGSLNVAAVWFGGALGLARSARTYAAGRPATLNLVAQLDVEIMQLQALLRLAARATDLDSDRTSERLELRALRVRHAMYTGCLRVLNVAAEAGGTNAAARDGAQARRLADLPVYLRQHHPANDLLRAAQLSQSLNSTENDPCRQTS